MGILKLYSRKYLKIITSISLINISICFDFVVVTTFSSLYNTKSPQLSQMVWNGSQRRINSTQQYHRYFMKPATFNLQHVIVIPVLILLYTIYNWLKSTFVVWLICLVSGCHTSSTETLITEKCIKDNGFHASDIAKCYRFSIEN